MKKNKIEQDKIKRINKKYNEIEIKIPPHCI